MEVALATAILGVVLVGLIGMIPSGAQTFQKAMDTSVTAQISQRVLHDAEQGEFDTLIDKTSLPPDPEGKSYCPRHFTFRAPGVSRPGYRYYDAEGTEIVPKNDGSLSESERRAVVYYASMRVMPRAVLPTLGEGGNQTALLTIQVARNPGHLDLAYYPGAADDANEPNRNLLRPGRVAVFTYSALVGKNNGR